jgi:hypothetical protein
MLNRKPHIGETLIYDTSASHIEQPPREFLVTRIEGNLLHYVDRGEAAGPIIWQFKDGLNKCLFHKEAADVV